MVELWFIFNLEYRYVVLSREMQIDCLTRSKVLIDHPSEDPERKPLRTNLEILGRSSLDLVDQVGYFSRGLEFSDPNQSGSNS